MNVTQILQSAAISKGGKQHAQNEDAIYHVCHGDPAGTDVGLFIVSDGLGAHEAGDRASRLAIQTVEETILSSPGTEPADPGNEDARRHQLVHQAVSNANRHIFHTAQNEQSNMAATIAMAMIVSGSAYMASVGDSRVYLWRWGALERITEDHSIAAELARINQINEEDVATHPRSNLLSRALGQKETVEVDLFRRVLEDGDRLLICSDGLWKPFPDQHELAELLGRPVSAAEICAQLVDIAVSRDGSDDTSAIVVQVRAVETALRKEEFSLTAETDEMEHRFADLVPA